MACRSSSDTGFDPVAEDQLYYDGRFRHSRRRGPERAQRTTQRMLRRIDQGLA